MGRALTPVKSEDMAKKSIPEETIPIIDFSLWTSSKASSSDRLVVAQELVAACHDTGFVYLKNHGVSPELLEEAFTWSKKLFDLPKEKKMQAAHPDGSISFRGYAWPGLENLPDLTEDPKKTTRSVKDHNVRFPCINRDNSNY